MAFLHIWNHLVSLTSPSPTALDALHHKHTGLVQGLGSEARARARARARVW